MFRTHVLETCRNEIKTYLKQVLCIKLVKYWYKMVCIKLLYASETSQILESVVDSFIGRFTNTIKIFLQM